MVLGRQVSNEEGQSFMQAVELTEDHKPDNPIECRRINEAGGRVDRLVSGTGLHGVPNCYAVLFCAVLCCAVPGGQTCVRYWLCMACPLHCCAVLCW